MDAASAGGPGSHASSVDRRSFFRVFSRQTVTAVAQVAGIAGAVQRGTAAAVVEAVGIGLGNPADNAARFDAAAAATAGAVPDAEPMARGARFTSAYRLDDSGLVIIDQRALPDRVEPIVCVRAADVAFQMRTFACNGASLLAQLAAYGMALSAREARGWPRMRRGAELRRSAQLLSYARPTAHPVRVAVARMEAVAATAGGPEHEDGDAIADALMDEADAIAAETATTNSAIARATADLLRPADGEPVRVLMLGDPGQLTNGQVGTGVTALQLLAQANVPLTVWVADGGPRREGGRLGSWELRNAGIEHAVVGDAALAWLLAREPIDAVLVAVDWIGPTGDAIGPIGVRQAAELAALRLTSSQTSVIALAPAGAIADESFDLSRLPDPALVPGALDPATGIRVKHPDPSVELLPAALIGAIVTERGVHRPPFSASLPEAA